MQMSLFRSKKAWFTSIASVAEQYLVGGVSTSTNLADLTSE